MKKISGKPSKTVEEHYKSLEREATLRRFSSIGLLGRNPKSLLGARSQNIIIERYTDVRRILLGFICASSIFVLFSSFARDYKLSKKLPY